MNLQATSARDGFPREGHARAIAEPPATIGYSVPNSMISGELLSQPSREPWPRLLELRRAEVTTRPRQTIYRAGDVLEGVPVVCDGWAARVSRLSNGRRQILSFVLPGDLVSTNAVFAESLNFFVEAITAVRYSAYDRPHLSESLGSSPQLVRALVGACLAEKDEADQLATNLGRRRAEERIARLFLHLQERLETRGLALNGALPIPLRQQQIADATGLTPVHVNRVIGSMRSHGLIEMADGILKIANLSALQRLAD